LNSSHALLLVPAMKTPAILIRIDLWVGNLSYFNHNFITLPHLSTQLPKNMHPILTLKAV
ncbi:MAG: hypothetical protein WCN64_05510, partial [Planctomycetota bacterium]